MIVDIMEEKSLDIFDKMIKRIDGLETRAILTESKVNVLEYKVMNLEVEVSNLKHKIVTAIPPNTPSVPIYPYPSITM